ncbi:MAG: bifunctional metallophosphatase/5'-nucleotidase, partial [Plesiomonas sp.]
IVRDMLNRGEIQVPSLENGRYTNTASINVKPYLFADATAKQQAVSRLLQQVATADNAADKQALQDKLRLIAALN